MLSKRQFGDLELAILKQFEGQKRLTVKDVLPSLGSDDKYTTVMTVMHRMWKKKLLQREKNGLQYEYWTTSSSPTFLEKVKEKFFSGQSFSLSAFLIESGEFSNEELSELESLIKKKKKGVK